MKKIQEFRDTRRFSSTLLAKNFCSSRQSVRDFQRHMITSTLDVDILWDKYRIVADSIDEDLNEYGSKHLPSVLQPEQVQVLVECGNSMLFD